MEKENLISQLQMAIAKGQLEKVIEYFINNLKLFDNYLVNNIIQVSAYYKSSKDDYASQLIDEKDFRQAKAKTTSSLLMILDDLPENINYPVFSDANLPKEEPKPESQKPKTASSHAEMIETLLQEYKTQLILEGDPKRKMAIELEIQRLEKLMEEL